MPTIAWADLLSCGQGTPNHLHEAKTVKFTLFLYNRLNNKSIQKNETRIIIYLDSINGSNPSWQSR